MKRSWIGFALLMVLLLGGIFSSWLMGKIHEDVEQDLLQGAECAALGDWDNGIRFFREAKNRWDRWKGFRACFADHGPTEEIDAGFSALEVYGWAREDIPFTAQCCDLAKQVAAVGQAHKLSWENLF